MRLKPVPDPPADRETLAAAQRAVPLVPGTESDCCARLMERTGLGPREEARRWLTFLRALGLVERTDAGFVRTDRDPADEAVDRAFRERVFLAAEVLATLGDEPQGAGAVFDRVAGRVPTWEREKHSNWRPVWRETVERLLGWAVLLGAAERVEGGYRRP